jgi:hypothetical protein
MLSRKIMRSLNQQRSISQQPKGAILPLVALLVFILFAMAAFSVDVAYMQLVKIELKTSVDAAARAGGEALSREQDVGLAKVAAKNLATLNTVGSDPLLLEDSDIIPGKSTLSESTGRWSFVPEATPYNSIRVIGRRTTGSPSGPVPLFFARIFGIDIFQVTDRSTVVRVDRDIMLVVDRSSSMKLAIDHPTGNMSTSDDRFDEPPRSDSRWAALELAVQEFITALGETPQVEWVGLVSYASNYSRFGVNNTQASIDEHLTESHTNINNDMNDYTNTIFNGLTHISAGIDEGVDALFNATYSRPYALKTMVLMTDGIPNPATPQAVLNSAQAAANQNVKIYTVSFGTAADQNLMQQVAIIGDGKHYHAANAQELKDIFREIGLTIPLTFTE